MLLCAAYIQPVCRFNRKDGLFFDLSPPLRPVRGFTAKYVKIDNWSFFLLWLDAVLLHVAHERFSATLCLFNKKNNDPQWAQGDPGEMRDFIYSTINLLHSQQYKEITCQLEPATHFSYRNIDSCPV